MLCTPIRMTRETIICFCSFFSVQNTATDVVFWYVGVKE